MHGGVAAELVLPKNTTKETKDAIRSSHIFSPAKLMIEKDSISWNNDIKAFECSMASDTTASFIEIHERDNMCSGNFTQI